MTTMRSSSEAFAPMGTPGAPGPAVTSHFTAVAPAVARPTVSRTRFRPISITAAGSGQARQTPEDVLRSARATGYADGIARAERHVAQEQARRQAEHDAAVATLVEESAAARARIEASVAAALTHWEEDARPELFALADLVVDAAATLAVAILDQEVGTGAERARAAVRRALAEVPGDEPVTVHLAPADVDALTDPATDGAAYGVRTGAVRIVADGSLRPGDALATSPSRRVDARLAAALDRAVQTLRHEVGPQPATGHPLTGLVGAP